MTIHEETEEEENNQYEARMGMFLADTGEQPELLDPNTAISIPTDKLPEDLAFQGTTSDRTSSPARSSSVKPVSEDTSSEASLAETFAAKLSLEEDVHSNQAVITGENPFKGLISRTRFLKDYVIRNSVSSMMFEGELITDNPETVLGDIEKECQHFLKETEALKRFLRDTAASAYLFESLRSSTPDDEVAHSVWKSIQDTASSEKPKKGDTRALEKKIKESIPDDNKRHSFMATTNKKLWKTLKNRDDSYQSVDEQLTEAEENLPLKRSSDNSLPTSTQGLNVLPDK